MTLEATHIGNPTLNILIFGLFVAATLGIVLKASRNNKTAADYYAGGAQMAGAGGLVTLLLGVSSRTGQSIVITVVGFLMIKAAPGKVNSAAPLLANHLGGELLLAIIAAVAFATIRAMVAVRTITASASSPTTSMARSSSEVQLARLRGEARLPVVVTGAGAEKAVAYWNASARGTARRVPLVGYRSSGTARRVPLVGYRSSGTARRVPLVGYRSSSTATEGSGTRRTARQQGRAARRRPTAA